MIVFLLVFVQDHPVDRLSLSSQDEFNWRREYTRTPRKDLPSLPFKIKTGHTYIVPNGDSFRNTSSPGIGIEFGEDGFFAGIEVHRIETQTSWTERRTVNVEKITTKTETANICDYFTQNPNVSIYGDLSGLPWYIAESPINTFNYYIPNYASLPPEAFYLPVKDATLLSLDPTSYISEPSLCEIQPVNASRTLFEKSTEPRVIEIRHTKKAELVEVFLYTGYRYKFAEHLSAGSKIGIDVLEGDEISSGHLRLGGGMTTFMEFKVGTTNMGLESGLKRPFQELKLGPRELRSIFTLGAYVGFRW